VDIHRTARIIVGMLLAGLAALSGRAAVTNVSYTFPSFTPPVITIHAGDTVLWTNGIGFHTLAGTGSDPICGGATLPCGHTFPNVGSFTYECTVVGHAAAGMTGLVIVVAATLPPSPAMLKNATMTNRQFSFSVLTTANRTNIVQATTNLASSSNWISIGTNVPATNVFNFTDTNASGFRLRFYRVIEPP
jgi:plastocyanin